MEIHAMDAAITRRPRLATQVLIRAANDNGGHRVTVRLMSPSTITLAEVEVFGSLLAELEAASANDNFKTGDAA